MQQNSLKGLRRYFELEESLKTDPKNRKLQAEMKENSIYLTFLKELGQRRIRREAFRQARAAFDGDAKRDEKNNGKSRAAE